MNEMAELHPSALESSRFGIVVERGRFDSETSTSSIVRVIEESAADLIVLRLPAGRSDVATHLQAKGEMVIHADTLVYHGVDLDPSSGRAAAHVRPASAADRGQIARIAGNSFRNYRAHYAANPLLPQQAVLDGYIEWAQSRLSSHDPRSATWVVIDDETVAGFATCDICDGVVEIVLNAVDPAFERRGHYGALLSHLLHFYGSTGMTRLVISTQVWNYTVQRQWARAGLLLDTAFDTYHVERRLRLDPEGEE